MMARWKTRRWGMSMAVLFTLLAGLPLFWLAHLGSTGRVVAGLAGAELWALAWVLGLGLLRLRRRRHLATPDLPMLVGAALLVWVIATNVVVGTLSTARGGLVILALFVFVAAGIGMLLTSQARRIEPAVRALPGSRVVPPLDKLALAGVPMLIPALALVGIRALPEAEQWAGDIANVGMSGLLFVQLASVAWPALVIVAWGVDQSDGSTDRVLHRIALGLAVLALAFTCVVPYADPSDRVWAISRLQPNGTRLHVIADFAALQRTASWMLLACAVLSASAFTALGRGRRGLGLLEVVVLVAIAAGGTVYGVPRMGPEASPMACAAACVVAWIVSRVRG